MLIKSMLLLCGLTCSVAQADLPAARKWLKQEFRQSSISPEQQLAEMQWFIDAAKPFRACRFRSGRGRAAPHVTDGAGRPRLFAARP